MSKVFDLYKDYLQISFGLATPTGLSRLMDNSTGLRYLVNNKLDLTINDFISIYHKRWSIEEYHKSFKQNTSMEKSPTRTVKTQKTHVFASLIAYIKLERYKFSNVLNHLAQKSKLFLNATKLAFHVLQNLTQRIMLMKIS